MVHQLVVDDWVFELTKERDYVNFSALANLHGLAFISWYIDPKIRFIIENLETRGLEPVIFLRGDCYGRIELLDTFLTPEFASWATPEFLPDTIPNLVDYMLTQAGKRMGEKPAYINSANSNRTSNRKVDLAAQEYNNSVYRRQIIGMVDDAMSSAETVLQVRQVLTEVRETIPEVHDFLRALSAEATGMIEGVRRIIRAIRRQEDQLQDIKRKVSYLRAAIDIETIINASQYRLLLAQLMIYASHKRWDKFC